MIKKIANTLLDISSEVILKRRQKLFKDLLDADKEGVVVNLVSLSLALKGNLDITLKDNISEKDTTFSSFFGLHTYYFMEGDFKKLRASVRTFPKNWQVIAQYVYGDKFKTSLRLEFLYDVLPTIYPLSHLANTFIEIPESVDKSSKYNVVMHDSVKTIHYPFKLYNVNSHIRKKGELKYYFKVGTEVETNIQVRSLKKYLEESFINKYQYGVVLLTSKKKGRNSPSHIQPLIMSEDITTLKELYRGSEVADYEQKVSFYADRTFKNTSKLVKVHYSRPAKCVTVHEIPSISGGVKDGNYLLHSGGFTRLTLNRETLFLKVVDYIFNDSYEPIGLKLKEGDNILEVNTEVSDSFVSRGIENTYVKVAKLIFADEVLETEFYSVLNTKYGECPLCGTVASLKNNGLCWRCSGKLFRMAVESGGHKNHTILADCHKVGFITTIYKYKVEFTETGINFEEYLEGWKGKQLYLPSDWWV